MQQLDLFSQIEVSSATQPPLPPEDKDASKETSQLAYQSTDRGRDRKRIAEYMRMLGAYGATRDELCHSLGIPLPTVCGRCNELLKSGTIYSSKLRRQTTTGASAAVLIYRIDHDTNAIIKDGNDGQETPKSTIDSQTQIQS